MPSVLVLQHADWELPGCYGDILEEFRARVTTVRPDRGEPLPDWRPFHAILAMGGPMSVNDEPRLPWLRDEKRLVQEAVRAGVPYLGACLGAQLLAAALGARVYPGPRPEFGVYPVHTTADAHSDPLFHGLPARLDVFQWHGETFDLPADAVRLAGSPGYPQQAFRAGDRAYGLQFHLEVTTDLLAKWLAVPACLDEARRHLGPTADERLTTQLQAVETAMLALARRLFARWLGLLQRDRPAR